MMRECRLPAREPATSWLTRRSTMATSTRESASSAANISPVGPPPAITTACVVMAMTVRHDPGLAASPRLRHKLEVEGDGSRAPLLVPCVPPPANGGAPNTAITHVALNRDRSKCSELLPEEMNVRRLDDAFTGRAAVRSILEIEDISSRQSSPDEAASVPRPDLAVVHPDRRLQRSRVESDLQVEPLAHGRTEIRRPSQLKEISTLDPQVDGPLAGRIGMNLEHAVVLRL